MRKTNWLYSLSMLMIAIVFFLASASTVEAWWNTSYEYRHEVNVTADDGVYENVTIIVPVNETIFDTSLEYSTIAFADNSDNLLYYWYDVNQVNSASDTYFYVRVNSSDPIYIYYSVNNYSSLSTTDTFIMFDDFDDQNLNGWNAEQCGNGGFAFNAPNAYGGSGYALNDNGVISRQSRNLTGVGTSGYWTIEGMVLYADNSYWEMFTGAPEPYNNCVDTNDKLASNIRKPAGDATVEYQGSLTDLGEATFGTWHLVTTVYNLSASKIIGYLNWTQGGTVTVGRGNISTLTHLSLVGPGSATAHYLDEMKVFKGAPNTTSFVYGAQEGVSVIRFINQTPANNTQWSNTTLTFELNINNTGATEINCTLDLNGTKVYSDINTSAGVNKFTTDQATVEGLNTYFWYCFDNETNTLNTTVSQFYTDVTLPSIGTDFINNSQYMYGLQNITGNFNFTDEQIIFSVNISIDGVQQYYVEPATTYVDYNLSVLADQSIGSHTLTARVADGHTKMAIAPYNVTEGSYLEFLTKNNLIRITPEDGTLSAEKLIDRYSFEYEIEGVKDKFKFTIDADEEIKIIEAPNTKWKKWLVIGNHWLDFYKEGENRDITINIINPYQVEVEVEGFEINDNKIRFDSIGELNIVEQNYTFINRNLTTTFETDLLDIEVGKYSITLLNTTDYGARFFWNGTEYNVTTFVAGGNTIYNSTVNVPNISVNNVTKEFYWNLNGTTGNFNTTNYNQTVWELDLDDCSAYSSMLNYTYKDESTLNNVNATFDVTYTLFTSDSHSSKMVSFNFSSLAKHRVCKSTSLREFYLNATGGYNANLYDQRNYLATEINSSLDQEIILYLINSSDSSNVIISLFDRNGVRLPDYFIQILRYDQGSGEYILVQNERTDTSGQTLGKLILYDVYYKFIVIRGNTTFLSTSPSIILSTAKTLTIDLEPEILVDWKKVGNTLGNVSFVNSSKTFAFTWSNSGNIVKGCINVSRVSILGGDTRLYAACSNSQSNTLFYTITENTTNRTYYATGTINGLLLDSETVSFAGQDMRNTFGNYGVLAGIFLLLTLSFVFSWNSTVLIMGSAFGLLVVSMLSLWGGVTMGMIAALILLGGIIIARTRQ